MISEKTSLLGNKFVCMMIIFISSFFVFYNSLQNELTTWDDEKYITENVLIKKSSVQNIKDIFTKPYFDNYSPLHLLTYMLEYKLFGIKAPGYHFFSVLLHCINALLVFYFLLLLLKNQRHAFFATLLFALHPLRTESVAWASEQKDLLFSFFYLLGLIHYLKLRQTKNSSYYFSMLLWFILSLLSKSTAITFPLVLLLIDYYYTATISWKDLKNKIPVFMLSFVLGVITIYAQKEEALVANPYLGIMERLPIACFALVKYVWQILFPFNLSAFYPYPVKINAHLPLWCWLFVIPVALLVYYVVKNFRKQPVLIFFILFFVFTNLLTLQLIPVGSAMMADRYSYLPSIGISMLIILLSEKYFQRIPALQKNSTFIYFAFLLLLSYLTIQQNKVWKNSMSLYDSVLTRYPNQAVFYNNRGAVKVEQKDFAGGLSDFESAIRSDPGYYLSYYNLGNYYKDQKQFESALENYNQSILLKPTAKGYCNRGVLFAILKNYDAAIPDFDKAIAISKDYALAYKNRGLAFIYTNRANEGCTDLLQAVNLGNENAQEYYKKHCLGL